jgi:hypothetical protein
MNDQTIEQEIRAKGLTAPRVTQDRIIAVIASEHYFTALDGERGAQMFNNPAGVLIPEQTGIALGLLTFCVLVLANGFTVTGESACASPENFNAELGRKIARANAVNKIWPLEGYLLKQQLHDQAANRFSDDASVKLKIHNADPTRDVRIVTGADDSGLVGDQMLKAGERASFDLPNSGQIVINGPGAPNPVSLREDTEPGVENSVAPAPADSTSQTDEIPLTDGDAPTAEVASLDVRDFGAVADAPAQPPEPLVTLTDGDARLHVEGVPVENEVSGTGPLLSKTEQPLTSVYGSDIPGPNQ